MLSVGRELNISNKRVVCRTCSWQGTGAELSDGLVQINSARIYFYVYRCPECAGVDLACKGKLLQFRRRPGFAQEDDDAAQPHSERAMS